MVINTVKKLFLILNRLPFLNHFKLVLGFLSAILAITIIGACVYKNVPISDYILNNSVQLAVSGWLIGLILALSLYIKAERGPVANLNIYASTNSRIYNFWQGKEINPRIGALDIKLLLMRASLIGMVSITLFTLIFIVWARVFIQLYTLVSFL